MTGTIPQSDALREAAVDSLAELMSRDPEGLQKQDRMRIIEAMRQHREKIAKVEASGEAKPRRGVKALSELSPASAEDLGL